ncbi:cupin [bacterium]|nr:cupin [bacterium]
MKKDFRLIPYSIKVKKPWGWELIFSPPQAPVTGKILHLNKGCRFSLQYHDQKEEVLMLVKGKAKIILEDNKGKLVEQEMVLRKGYWIKPFQKHRCWALTDCEIVEVSTPEKGNTVRVEDDYHRGTETEEEREKLRKEER